jgi:hypothetical protein
MADLVEMTKVMLAKPGPGASDIEVAAWYELKAQLLEHIAADGRPAALGRTTRPQRAGHGRPADQQRRDATPAHHGARPHRPPHPRPLHTAQTSLTGVRRGRVGAFRGES